MEEKKRVKFRFNRCSRLVSQICCFLDRVVSKQFSYLHKNLDFKYLQKGMSTHILGSKPGPSLFVSGRKFFISRMELTNTGDVTYYITIQSLHPQFWEFFSRYNWSLSNSIIRMKTTISNKRFQELLVNSHIVLMREMSQK